MPSVGILVDTYHFAVNPGAQHPIRWWLVQARAVVALSAMLLSGVQAHAADAAGCQQTLTPALVDVGDVNARMLSSRAVSPNGILLGRRIMNYTLHCASPTTMSLRLLGAGAASGDAIKLDGLGQIRGEIRQARLDGVPVRMLATGVAVTSQPDWHAVLAPGGQVDVVGETGKLQGKELNAQLEIAVYVPQSAAETPAQELLTGRVSLQAITTLPEAPQSPAAPLMNLLPAQAVRQITPPLPTHPGF